MARDPVCGMSVEPSTAEFSYNDFGQVFYFCSKACENAFIKNRAHYTKKKGVFTRFLEWLSRANREKFGDKPPSCCGH